MYPLVSMQARNCFQKENRQSYRQFDANLEAKFQKGKYPGLISPNDIIPRSFYGFAICILTYDITSLKRRRTLRSQMCDVCMQCTGWLCKQPVGRAGLDHSNALTSGWKTRFFCLGNDALSYYTYRPKEHRLKLKGAIPVMAGCLCCILLGVVIGRVLGV